MTDAQLLFNWTIGLSIATVVVVIAAALLLAVLAVAKRIEQGAGVALELVKQIRENTQVIWALQETNQVASHLQAGAEAILNNAGQIAQALHEADVRRGRS
ncbi:MAG TPA: hypothetical protein VF177_20930 [Anaerolineae bacterium]